ncbi:MAG: hypothetical protein M3R14_02565 [Acidobacteriota bacterium]|nr:hypothetical protein [Acidobacteriota bacterium]
MKRHYLKFRIMLMTFALGLASVWFLNNLKTNDEAEIKDTMVISIAPKQPRFTESFRGCGMGYVQGYITNDGIELTEGNLSCEKPRKRGKQIIKSDSERIISKIEIEDKTYYEIYQLKNKHCINSPTIELGLELENYLKISR